MYYDFDVGLNVCTSQELIIFVCLTRQGREVAALMMTNPDYNYCMYVQCEHVFIVMYVLVGSVPMHGATRGPRVRTLSMEEYDQPRLRR